LSNSIIPEVEENQSIFVVDSYQQEALTFSSDERINDGPGVMS
jgi:hypothetical protein